MTRAISLGNTIFNGSFGGVQESRLEIGGLDRSTCLNMSASRSVELSHVDQLVGALHFSKDGIGPVMDLWTKIAVAELVRELIACGVPSLRSMEQQDGGGWKTQIYGTRCSDTDNPKLVPKT